MTTEGEYMELTPGEAAALRERVGDDMSTRQERQSAADEVVYQVKQRLGQLASVRNIDDLGNGILGLTVVGASGREVAISMVIQPTQ